MRQILLPVLALGALVLTNSAFAACESEIAAVKQGSFPSDPAKIQAALECVRDSASGGSSSGSSGATTAQLDAACSVTSSAGCTLDTNNSALQAVVSATGVATMLGVDTSVTTSGAVFMRKYTASTIPTNGSETGPRIITTLTGTGTTNVVACTSLLPGLSPGARVENNSVGGSNTNSGEVALATNGSSLSGVRVNLLSIRPTTNGFPSSIEAWVICYFRTSVTGSNSGVPLTLGSTITSSDWPT